MTTKDQIVYRLSAVCRFDEDVNAFIGYIPCLRVYTQARIEADLPKALTATATAFILACANKGILSSVLREAGSTPKSVTAEEIAAVMDKGGNDFVAVMGYKECAEQIEVSVPLSLIAAQEALAVA